MRRSLGPLLCELHAHSGWSDGALPLSELVDLHGRSGFDVLCVTDHVVRRDDPWREREGIRFRSGGPGTTTSRDEKLRGLVHRFELFNRTQLFGWVAEAGLPAVAAGDFHRPEHLAGWKTLLPSLREESALVDYLRSPRPVYLARFDLELSRAAA